MEFFFWCYTYCHLSLIGGGILLCCTMDYYMLMVGKFWYVLCSLSTWLCLNWDWSLQHCFTLWRASKFTRFCSFVLLWFVFFFYLMLLFNSNEIVLDEEGYIRVRIWLHLHCLEENMHCLQWITKYPFWILISYAHLTVGSLFILLLGMLETSNNITPKGFGF